MNNKLIIGIDIDNTITNLYELEVERGREFCKEFNLSTDNFNPHCINVKEMYNIPDDLYSVYMNRYFRYNVNRVPPRKMAVSVINTLCTYYSVHIVTARDKDYKGEYSGSMMVQDTYNYFNHYGFRNNIFHFSSFNKADVCKQYGINVLIEDDPKHIKECVDSGIIVIVMSTPYNQDMRDLMNTVFIESWDEVPAVISSIEYFLKCQSYISDVVTLR